MTSPEKPAGGVGVVFCCAAEDRVALAPVLEQLSREGHDVELVSGVEREPGILEAVVQRRLSEGIYVLCRSPRLGQAEFSGLQQVLQRFGVSNSSVLAIGVGAGDSAAISQPIRQAVQRMGRGRATVLQTSRPAPIRATSPALAPAAPPPAPPRAAAPPPAPPAAPPPQGPPPRAAADDDEVVESFGTGARLATALRQLPRSALLAAGVGVLLLVGGGSVVMCGADDDAVESEAVAQAASTKPDAPKESAKGDGPPADAAGPADAAAPTEDVVPEPAPADPVPAPAEPEPEAESPPADEDEPEVGSAAEQTRIDAAVRARRIRVLDIMLVDARRSKRLRFDKADKWCADRKIEGVGAWRLPTVGEVSSLTLNGVVARDSYWSQTKGDTFGDKMLMWSGKRKRIQPTKKSYRGARAVCVRTRDGRPPDDNEMEVKIDE